MVTGFLKALAYIFFIAPVAAVALYAVSAAVGAAVDKLMGIAYRFEK